MKVSDKIVYEVDEFEEYLNEKVDEKDEEQIICEMEDFLCDKSALFFIEFRNYIDENALQIGEYMDVGDIYDFVSEILEDQLDQLDQNDE